jgi:hypothetical protein
MESILREISLSSIASASICAMLGLLFVADSRMRWVRLLTVFLGVLVIGLPIYASLDALGYPSPWPEPGRYDVLGWKFDEARKAIYTFVKRPEDRRPSLYRVQFDMKTAVDMQNARQHPEHIARISMVVEPGADGQNQARFEFEKKIVIQSPAEEAAREQDRRREEAARLNPAQTGDSSAAGKSAEDQKEGK